MHRVSYLTGDFTYSFVQMHRNINFANQFFDIFPIRNYHEIEPVGSVAPKVSLADELQVARVRIGHILAMICRAQSYPIPVFR